MLDRLLPRWDFSERHQILVRASAPRVYATLLQMNLRSAPLSRILFFLRELPWRLARRDFSSPGLGFTLEDMLKLGFIDLGRTEGEELVMGLVARPWRLRPDILRLTPDEFMAFDRASYVKVAANFRAQAQNGSLTRLSTETRVLCLGRQAKRAFRIYWTIIRPGSGLIRGDMLRLTKKNAETVT